MGKKTKTSERFWGWAVMVRLTRNDPWEFDCCGNTGPCLYFEREGAKEWARDIVTHDREHGIKTDPKNVKTVRVSMLMKML